MKVAKRDNSSRLKSVSWVSAKMSSMAVTTAERQCHFWNTIKRWANCKRPLRALNKNNNKKLQNCPICATSTTNSPKNITGSLMSMVLKQPAWPIPTISLPQTKPKVKNLCKQPLPSSNHLNFPNPPKPSKTPGYRSTWLMTRNKTFPGLSTFCHQWLTRMTPASPSTLRKTSRNSVKGPNSSLNTKMINRAIQAFFNRKVWPSQPKPQPWTSKNKRYLPNPQTSTSSNLF